MKISIVLITLNEEKNLADCLQSVQWADEWIVVDSGSSDATLQIAERFKARIFSHPFKNFAEQKNFALAQASGEWIFLIDADERATPALADEIRGIISAGFPEAVYQVRRRTFFFKKPLRFSGTQNDAPIRLFPKGKAHYEQPVHEFIRTPLPLKRLKSVLLHFTTRDYAQYREKLGRYLALEIETMRLQKRTVFFWDVWVRPIAKFVTLYILQLGLLDGLTGFQLAMLSAYYDYLKFSRFLKEKDE